MGEKTRWVVIPAAGRGERFGGTLPKQYAVLGGRMVLEHTLARFTKLSHLAGIVVALAPDDRHFQKLSLPPVPVHTTIGGATRAESVLAALEWLSAGPGKPDDWVLVHDAARPLLPRSDLDALVRAGDDNGVGGLLGLPVADTLKRASDHEVAGTLPRENLWRAQTPQMFRLGALRDALAAAGPAATDEAMAMEQAGAKPTLVHGSSTNVKITTVADLVVAEALLKAAGAAA